MDDSNQNRVELLLGNCLNCQGLVRIPVTAQASKKVRCPHCAQSFYLAQILEHSVPELEVVDDSVTRESVHQVDRVSVSNASEHDEREAFVVPPQLSKGAKRRRSGRSSSRKSDGSSSGEHRESSRSSGSGRSSSSSSSRKQAARPQTKPAFEVVKVLIGGALAIPIAYLLVLWVFSQDPLDVGPSISNVAPFVVPQKFRGGPEIEIEEPGEAAPLAEDVDIEKLTIPSLDPDKVLKDIGS